VSSTFSIAPSSTKSRSVFHFVRSIFLLLGWSNGLSRTVAEGLCCALKNVLPFLPSRECWLPNREEPEEVWWKPGGTSCAPRNSRILSRDPVRLERTTSHAYKESLCKKHYDVKYAGKHTHLNLLVQLSTLMLNTLSNVRRKLNLRNFKQIRFVVIATHLQLLKNGLGDPLDLRVQREHVNGALCRRV